MQLISDIEVHGQTILEWFRAYYGNGIFFVATMIALIYLCIVNKDLRYKLIVPILTILMVVINPILYQYIFSKITYWRLLWMLPNVVIIAVAGVVFLKRQKWIWMKWIVLSIITLFTFGSGKNVFQYGWFSTVDNWEKISQATIDICDVMLSVDEKPRAIVPRSLYIEVRQYAPQVELMYGRNVEGYIRQSSSTEWLVSSCMEEEQPEYKFIFSTAVKMEYNFVVVTEEKDIDDEVVLEQFGYENIWEKLGYIVYYRRK